MMYGISSYSGLAIGMHIHWIFALLFLLGIVSFIVWLARFAKKDQLLPFMWVTLLLGVLGMLFTAPMAYRGMMGMMWGLSEDELTGEDFENRYGGMMQQWFEEWEEEEEEEEK